MEDAAFLAGIRDHPADDLRRLVYADWLDERGTDDATAQADYLRLEVHVHTLPDAHPERDGFILKLRELAARLPLDWKTAVAKVDIENCGVRWRFQCPKRWDQLTVFRDENARYCTACRRSVHYCESVEAARAIAEEVGFCVVIDLGAVRAKGDMDLLRGPAELEVERDEFPTLMEDFNPGAPGESPRSVVQPGFLRRLWRKLRGQ